MTALTGRLSAAEVDFLSQCEDTIAEGLHTFIEVGTALAAVRDNRLYRAAFSTFDDYCAMRWGFTDSRARQLISAAMTVTNVTAAGLPAPANEGQARELARVPEEMRAEVWAETVERTEGKPTASAIRETAESMTPARRDAESVHPDTAVATPDEPVEPEEVAPATGGREGGAASSFEPPAGPDATAVHFPDRPGPDQVEIDRRARHTHHFATGIAALWSLLDPDPVAFAERTWLAERNPHAQTPGARDAFTVDGLRLLAKRLDRLADHAESNGGAL